MGFRQVAVPDGSHVQLGLVKRDKSLAKFALSHVDGIGHGFKLYFSAGRGKGIWDFTMILIGASAAFMIAGALVSSIGRGDLESVKWIRRGLIVSAAGFVIQKIGWDPHQHLNHNDIYHLIQIAGFWCLYEGVHQLGN